MEFFKEIVSLLSAVAWPAALLVVMYWLKSPLTDIVSMLAQSSHGAGRNIRFRMGQFEVESKIEENVKKRLEQIAEEESLEKRLEMAKQPFLVEDALREIDQKSMEALNILYNRRLKDACLINWYEPFDGVERDTYSKLANLGLIRGAMMYDGDEVAYFTPVGLALIQRVSQHQLPNKAIQPTPKPLRGSRSADG